MIGERTLWAQFASAEEVIVAAQALRSRGRKPLDAFTPYPLPELDRALETRYSVGLSRLTFLGGCIGGTLAFLVMWWTSSIDYPLNVGGRPLNSVIADIPIVFESAVLGAALCAFVGFLWSTGLPRLTHPLECNLGFRETTIDRFWLGIRAVSDEAADLASELRELSALDVQVEMEPPP